MQEIKSGQSTNETFLGAIQAAYQNLVYHPMVLLVNIVTIYEIWSLYSSDTKSPFLVLRLMVELKASQTSYEQFFFYIVFPLLDFLIRHSVTMLKLILPFVVYSVKPSYRNFMFALLVSIVFWLSGFCLRVVFILTQVFYLFAVLRSPSYKMIMLVVFLFLFHKIVNILSFFHI